MNPQFVVQIPRGPVSKCHVVVAVTQQYGTSLHPLNNSQSKDSKSSKVSLFHPIGFAVYEARSNINRVTTQFVTESVRILYKFLKC